MDLENFSGNGAEAVRQDFHATVYLTGLETILTGAAQAQLDAKETRHPQTVNRAVSFNAIKHHALDLLWSDLDTQPLIKRLTALFLTHPTCARPQCHPPPAGKPRLEPCWISIVDRKSIVIQRDSLNLMAVRVRVGGVTAAKMNGILSDL